MARFEVITEELKHNPALHGVERPRTVSTNSGRTIPRPPVVLDPVRLAELRNSANPGGPSRGSARAESRDRTPACSQTAGSKPLEQSPPPAVRWYDSLAREEAGLRDCIPS